jgi:hypothetical protein
MLEYLTEDIRKGLEAAQQRARRSRGRLAVHVGDAVFPLLRLWEQGFAVDSARVPRLRGVVDLYDGPTHLSHCLIVATQADGGETIYEFKRATPATAGAALDYISETPRPAGYLTADR